VLGLHYKNYFAKPNVSECVGPFVKAYCMCLVLHFV
jgi:hypothetical protein